MEFYTFSDFDWVEGDVCEVILDLENPMPFELKVASMVCCMSLKI